MIKHDVAVRIATKLWPRAERMQGNEDCGRRGCRLSGVFHVSVALPPGDVLISGNTVGTQKRLAPVLVSPNAIRDNSLAGRELSLQK